MNHLEFLELILQDELVIRQDRAVARRVKAAAFRDQKTLEDFDWDFNRSIKRKQVFDLAAGDFVRKHRDVLLVGPPGVGKSHIAQAVGLKMINAGYTVFYRSIFDTVRDLLHDEAFEGHDRIMRRYLVPDLLILDDMGMKKLPKRSGEFLFEIIMRRHELRSTMMTSNRPLTRLGQVNRRCSSRNRHPRPFPARRGGDSDHRQELSTTRRFRTKPLNHRRRTYDACETTSDSTTGMATRGTSLPHPLCLCHGSLAASDPTKVMGLAQTNQWNADRPIDFGGPAAVGEATEATATGKAPGIPPPV